MGSWAGSSETTSLEPASPGLSRFLGWTALEQSLRPVVEAFAPVA